MISPNKSRASVLATAALIVLGLIIQFANLRTNPPGIFIDESSIAYNAHLIATTGHDEHGESWPLFFRAFGEYKNPVYIYLLAVVFRLSGPSTLGARSLSTIAGLATVFLLSFLATRISGSRTAGILFGFFCLLTPWLFELSRLAMEVALYPLAVVLFLLAVWGAANKTKWQLREVCALAATLALLTYTYSIGRLLAPLLAVGLCFFVTRQRFPGLLFTWFAYGLTSIPLLVFNRLHPGALTGRFRVISYLIPERSWFGTVSDVLKHFASNLNPWRLFIRESSMVNEIVHIPRWPAMLTLTLVLVVISAVLLVRLRSVNSWWCFIAYGLIVSVIPASLTIDQFHMLRLAAMPVFLLVITIPAFMWMVNNNSRTRRSVLVVTMLIIATQGLCFQWSYQASATSPRRLHTFDADYPARILPAALRNAGTEPVYLADAAARPGYIQALWYGTLYGIPLNKFISLGFDKSAPEGAIVITTEESCPRCRVLAVSEPYTAYIAVGQPKELKPLMDNDMRAELDVLEPPQQVPAGTKAIVYVSVKNISAVPWPAGDRAASPFRVSAGNHWLGPNGQVIVNDDGRQLLPHDLNPRETVVVPLTINTPRRAGEYVLEIDLLQENVSWFGLKGSHKWRGKVLVND